MRVLSAIGVLAIGLGPAHAFDCSRMSDPSYLQQYGERHSMAEISRALERCLSPARRAAPKPRPHTRKKKVPQVGRECLEMDQPYTGSVGFWVNSCPYGVTVRWYHKRGAGLAWVKAYGRNTATVGPTAGVKSWDTCRSDRPYDIIPKRLPSGRYRCE